MQINEIKQRQTKYCDAIERSLKKLGHATNLQLLQSLRESYPEVSATTVHRATGRLARRGAIGIAPAACDGSMRYDFNTQPHDHFLCSKCGQIRDADVVEQVRPILELSIDGCAIEGRLTISGKCMNCKDIRL